MATKSRNDDVKNQGACWNFLARHPVAVVVRHDAEALCKHRAVGDGPRLREVGSRPASGGAGSVMWAPALLVKDQLTAPG